MRITVTLPCLCHPLCEAHPARPIQPCCWQEGRGVLLHKQPTGQAAGLRCGRLNAVGAWSCSAECRWSLFVLCAVCCGVAVGRLGGPVGQQQAKCSSCSGSVAWQATNLGDPWCWCATAHMCRACCLLRLVSSWQKRPLPAAWRTRQHMHAAGGRRENDHPGVLAFVVFVLTLTNPHTLPCAIRRGCWIRLGLALCWPVLAWRSRSLAEHPLAGEACGPEVQSCRGWYVPHAWSCRQPCHMLQRPAGSIPCSKAACSRRGWVCVLGRRKCGT